MAAGGARDYRGRTAQIHRHDDRKQRPSDDPRKSSTCLSSGRAQAEYAGDAADAFHYHTGAPVPARSGATAAPAIRSRRTREYDARAGASGVLRPVGIPHGKVGARLYQAHRRDHRGPQERRRSGDVGRSAVTTRYQGQRGFLLSQRALPQSRREGRDCVCRYLGWLRRRGGPLLGARTGLRRADSPPALGGRRLLHQVRCPQAGPLCRARNPAQHRQSGRTGGASGAGGPRCTGAECQPGRSPAAAGGRPGGAPERAAAGPVVSLTAMNGTAEGMGGGGGRANPSAVDAIAWRVLSKGEPMAAPSGRADDFSWPRGSALKAQPPSPDVAAAPATPDDAGATTKPAPGRASVSDSSPVNAASEQKPAAQRRPRRPNPYAQRPPPFFPNFFR